MKTDLLNQVKAIQDWLDSIADTNPDARFQTLLAGIADFFSRNYNLSSKQFESVSKAGRIMNLPPPDCISDFVRKPDTAWLTDYLNDDAETIAPDVPEKAPADLKQFMTEFAEFWSRWSKKV